MRSSRSWLLSVPMMLVLVLGSPPAVAAGGPPATWAWVVARQPASASYTPGAKDRGNSSGGTNTVVRSGTGSYTVTMPGVANAYFGGHVQVSALGAARYCTVISWGGSPAIEVTVHCHLLDGTLADSAFSVMFLTVGNSSGTIAYVWANQASTTDYTPSADYQWPGDITIHRASAGNYVVSLPGYDPSHGHFQVTGYGDAYCFVGTVHPGAGGVDVDVVCPAGDTRFDLLYLSDVGPTGLARPKAAYAFVRPLETGAARFLAELRYSSAGTTPRLIRSAVGQYTVTLRGMPRGGMALVTPLVSGDNVICSLTQIRKGAAPQKVRVKCAHPDGSAVDTNFLLAYTK